MLSADDVGEMGRKALSKIDPRTGIS